MKKEAAIIGNNSLRDPWDFFIKLLVIMGTGQNTRAFAEMCIRKLPNSFIYIMGRRISKVKAAFKDLQLQNEVETWKSHFAGS